MEWMILVMLVSALAGARTYRLFTIDTAGEPVRKLRDRLIDDYLLKPQDQGGPIPSWKFKAAELIDEGWTCPFCSGYWWTVAWLATGLATYGTNIQSLWFLLAGGFAANYIGGQLNAWLDVKPIKDGGGEVTEDGVETPTPDET